MDDEEYENTGLEFGLFMSWVQTCFQWEKTEPTVAELARARELWYPGAAPIDVVRRILNERK